MSRRPLFLSRAAARRELAALPPGGLARLYLDALAWHRQARGAGPTEALLASQARQAARGLTFPLSPAGSAVVALLRGCRREGDAGRLDAARARALYDAALASGGRP